MFLRASFLAWTWETGCLPLCPPGLPPGGGEAMLAAVATLATIAATAVTGLLSPAVVPALLLR